MKLHLESKMRICLSIVPNKVFVTPANLPIVFSFEKHDGWMLLEARRSPTFEIQINGGLVCSIKVAVIFVCQFGYKVHGVGLDDDVSIVHKNPFRIGHPESQIARTTNVPRQILINLVDYHVQIIHHFFVGSKTVRCCVIQGTSIIHNDKLGLINCGLTKVLP